MDTIRKIMSVFCALIILVSSFSLIAFTDDANVTYTGNTAKLIFEPGSKHSPTDLFANFKNVMPGASLTQKITVSNKANNKVKVKFYLRSFGSADEAYNDFLNQLTLTVTKESDTPMFDAAADKTAGLTDWVCLGTLYSGGELDLNVTLDVPETLDNKYQNQIGKIKWQFVAEEFPIEEPKWKCPVNEKHSYHIEETDGVSTFVCDDCGKTEQMKCKECGGLMHEVAVVEIDGKTYKVYPDGKKHYKTEDGRVHFYLNDKGIIDYYVIDGRKTDVKSVDEYTFYTYYECLDNNRHHTDPHIPQTGEDAHLGLWITLITVSGAMLLVLMFLKKRRRDGGEKVRAAC